MKELRFRLFKQLSLNFTLALSKTKLIVGVRLLSYVAKGLVTLGDNPVDFHDVIYCVSFINVKYFYNG